MAEGTDNASLQGGSSGEDTEVYSVDSYGTDLDYEMSAGSELESSPPASDYESLIPRWFTRPQTVTHPSTNRVWRSATTLIETNVLPLSQTANVRLKVYFITFIYSCTEKRQNKLVHF